ncbi:MAG: C40 family peptidase [Micavibrio sp.]|nr:C40 family peptidase [Micavibrio sp.]
MVKAAKGSRDFEIDAPRLIVREKPDDFGENINELLCGEAVEVIDDNRHWGHIRSIHDSYKGFVKMEALRLRTQKSHKVLVPVTHMYDAPNFRLDSRKELFFMSQVQATPQEHNGFIKLVNGKWIFKKHLMPLQAALKDHVEAAMMYLNAPYIWGGRSYMGVDCSGLVQLCMMAVGKDCPRDSEPQSKELGELITDEPPKRGDFVFFERHVGIMLDDKHALNATSRHMRCVIETLDTLKSTYNGGLLAIRRV